MKRKHPPAKELSRALRYLARHGFSVYGDNVTLSRGVLHFYGGCRDYDTASNIIAIAKARDAGAKEVDHQYD